MYTINEVWKDIPGYENYYKVSNTWKVFMKWKFKMNHSKKIYINPIELKISSNWKYKHCFVRLNWKKFYIHRLVAQAFLWLEIEEKKLFVCHKDDNPKNNCVNNLFLWSCKDNHDDMVKKWRMAINEKLPQTKMNMNIVKFIKDSKWKISQTNLSKMFNINQSHISRIQNNLSRIYATN